MNQGKIHKDLGDFKNTKESAEIPNGTYIPPVGTNLLVATNFNIIQEVEAKV